MVGEKFERGFEDEDTRVKVITEGRWEGMVALAGTSVGGEEIGGGLRCFVGFRRVFRGQVFVMLELGGGIVEDICAATKLVHIYSANLRKLTVYGPREDMV